MAADHDYLLIAALDFGTTYSGCAFQMTSDYDPKNPTLKILSPQAWNEGPARLMSMKTPTCLLLDRNKHIDSFGYMAEDKYAELCMDGDNGDFYFFRRFKMALHETKVEWSVDSMVTTVTYTARVPIMLTFHVQHSEVCFLVFFK